MPTSRTTNSDRSSCVAFASSEVFRIASLFRDSSSSSSILPHPPAFTSAPLCFSVASLTSGSFPASFLASTLLSRPAAPTAMTNCPNVLAHGSCADSTCRYAHNIVVCEPCEQVFATEDGLRLHMKSQRHKKRLGGYATVSSCSLCNINVYQGENGWATHVASPKHVKVATNLGVAPDVARQPGITLANEIHCDICQVIVQPAHQWGAHIKTRNHVRRESFAKYKTAVDDAEKDKNGVGIEGSLDFGFVEPAVARDGMKLTTTITTSQPFSSSVLVEVKLASSQGTPRTASPFSSSFPIQQSDRKVTSRKSIAVIFTLSQGHIGRYVDRAEFIFQDTQLRKQFTITRTLKAVVGNQAEHEALMPRTPYTPRRRTTQKPMLELVEGIKPPALHAIPYIGRLPVANIPSQLQGILSGSQSTTKLVDQIRRVFMPNVLDSDTYGRHHKTLLWIEEFKMEQDLERYDILDATLARHNNYYYLTVPGLAEKRPSVLVGDRIFVQEQGATDGRWFEGHVHVLRQAEVGLRFHGSFGRYSEGRHFHVRFKLNRIPVRRQHQAMDTAFTEERVLFPLNGHFSSAHVPNPCDASLNLYNKLIGGNPPQLQAVVSIVSSPRGSPPFVVFGPPGTGKTITIVEAIKQLLHKNPTTRILACAPSNSAADLIASRLRGTLGVDELFRFYAPSRFKNQVPDELQPYTYTQGDGHFSVPIMPRMRRFRVIVSTCVSASFAAGIGMPRGHFSHIFIDEAGQATEPEAFVSIKMMADPQTNIVLSGDPKQLGPIIRSGVARALGLETSYLERLMNRDAYSVPIGHGKSVVKLTKNFRSHNAILRFPNEKFYENDLQPCANPSVIDCYLNSPYLPSKKFPVVFHAVPGKDDREASSPSFFNIDEVLQVKDYVQRLKEDRRFRTADSDIGIVAPYHAQCLKLRTSLRSVADGIKVGSVEEFQGQERKVIIISTVRSSKEFVEYDLRHTLGFVANPRRFNVAVTRAQALLIVVGDPNVLGLDPLWRSFLNYIYSNGGWTGPDIPWDPTLPVEEAGDYDKAVREAAQLDMNEFARRMESLTMAEVEDELDANVDRPWRDVE
ncbi:unnamed protein product [Cyclocybe aegerita]|uniref:RNA helicase n=1 Tax=Cyclocybe aegerita TaxID=1973307 RepID=A0A8S0WZ40_CYCAE|nr:unnamed protein product [Cyclocybe aegerita]